MKELSIEGKTQRYDEALDRAKEMIKAMTNIGGVAKVDDIQYLFPELKESKDERIRRVIRGWIYTRPASFFDNGISKGEILAWLEKQGEKILANSAKTCKDEQETGKCFCDGECKAKKDDSIQINPSEYINDMGGNGCYLKNTTQASAEWSEEDEKEVAILEAYIRSNDWSERHIDRALGIVEELVNKVKSLRPQKQWKPTKKTNGCFRFNTSIWTNLRCFLRTS